MFVDVEGDTCNLDSTQIESKISRKTKAIIPVSLYGQIADMDAINEIAERHGLVVIEDAAQSFGASYRDRRSCNVSRIACASFFRASRWAAMAMAAPSLQAIQRSRRRCAKYECTASSLATTTRASVWEVEWIRFSARSSSRNRRFEWEVTQRQRIGARYHELFGALPPARAVVIRPDRTSVVCSTR